MTDLPAVRAVIFDFDLTLADSSAGFDACYRYAATGVGLPTVSPVEAGRMIGTPLHLAFAQLYGEERKDLSAEFIRLWQEHGDVVMDDLTRMLPGAAAALHRLHDAGLKLAIVSQKRRYRLEAVLSRESLLDCFETILGEEDVPAFKPDPRGLLLAAERLGVAKEASIYVGDTTIDGAASRNAGLAFVGVLTGFSKRDELEAWAPLAVLDSVGDLPAFLGH